jgi:hypothetical protein
MFVLRKKKHETASLTSHPQISQIFAD